MALNSSIHHTTTILDFPDFAKWGLVECLLSTNMSAMVGLTALILLVLGVSYHVFPHQKVLHMGIFLTENYPSKQVSLCCVIF